MTAKYSVETEKVDIGLVGLNGSRGKFDMLAHNRIWQRMEFIVQLMLYRWFERGFGHLDNVSDDFFWLRWQDSLTRTL